MRIKLLVAGISLVLGSWATSSWAATPYGALYEAGELTSGTVDSANPNSGNKNSILTRHPSENTWLAITENVDQSQWWRSDAYGLNWSQIANPLDGTYTCTQPGRHSITVFQNEVYFGYRCEEGAVIVRLEEGDGTGASAVTVVFDGAQEFADGNMEFEPMGFPTAAQIGKYMYYFYEHGVVRSNDGTTWEDVTTEDWPNAATLEATQQQTDDEGNQFIYLPFSDGTVYSYDGTTLTLIGEDFLGDAEATNLPAIGLFQSVVYVGNQNQTSGAKIYTWDGLGTTTWSKAFDYADEDTNNFIINKMLRSQKFDGDRYLVFFTANTTTGVEVASLDPDGNYLQLIDDGLGGDNPTNNNEVVSAVRDTPPSLGVGPVILFSTQAVNTSVSETKIYILQLSSVFDLSPVLDHFNVDELFGGAAVGITTPGYLNVGTALELTIPKKRVKAGYLYTLYVDGEAVDSAVAQMSRRVKLVYEGAAELAVGTSIAVQVGTTPTYGPKGAKVESTKEILGAERTIIIQ